MADLGAVAKTYDVLLEEHYLENPAGSYFIQPVELVSCEEENLIEQYVAPWAYDTRSMLSIDATGSLSGKVQVESIDTPNIQVRLYYRPTGQIIKSTFTNSSGVWTFEGLETGSDDYYVLAVDPDGGTSYNVVVYDRVEAI